MSGAAITLLTSLPAGAGNIPLANLGNAGVVMQVVNYQRGDMITGTTGIPADDTIPQITEGVQCLSLAITPKSLTNKLKIDVIVHMATASTSKSAALFQDATANALAAGRCITDGIHQSSHVTFTYFMTAGTISETTFTVRFGDIDANAATLNGTNGARKYGGVDISSITITEIKV